MTSEPARHIPQPSPRPTVVKTEPGVKLAQPSSSSQIQYGGAHGMTQTFRDPVIIEIPSDDEDVDLDAAFGQMILNAEARMAARNIASNNGNDRDRPRDKSPLNLSTAQKEAWLECRKIGNKYAEMTNFQKFLNGAKEANVHPDITMVRMHVPGIFSSNNQVDREYQQIWNNGLERASKVLIDTTLDIVGLKLDLLFTQQDSALHKLRLLLRDNLPQWERIKRILDSLIEQHNQSSSKKYTQMLDHLKTKRPAGTPIPPLS